MSILVNSVILHAPAGPQPGSITGAQVMWDNATNVATMVFVQGSSSSSWPDVRAPPSLPTTEFDDVPLNKAVTQLVKSEPHRALDSSSLVLEGAIFCATSAHSLCVNCAGPHCVP